MSGLQRKELSVRHARSTVILPIVLLRALPRRLVTRTHRYLLSPHMGPSIICFGRHTQAPLWVIWSPHMGPNMLPERVKISYMLCSGSQTYPVLEDLLYANIASSFVISVSTYASVARTCFDCMLYAVYAQIMYQRVWTMRAFRSAAKEP